MLKIVYKARHRFSQIFKFSGKPVFVNFWNSLINSQLSRNDKNHTSIAFDYII